MSRVLEWERPTAEGIWLRTTGQLAYATQADLDRARFRIHKMGDAWIGANALVEQDINTLHAEIRKARAA